MSSTSETGHAKNLANFHSLIQFAKGYGANYNPSKNALKIPQLEALLADAKASINNVSAQYGAYNTAINSRQIAFANLKPLATRIINALASTDASELVVKDAKTANRKIQGQRANTTTTPPPSTPDAPPPNTISVSQQSYTNQVQHFANLIIVLENETNYTPNETELSILTLRALKDHLDNLNDQVAISFTDISNARLARNTTLYRNENSIYHIATELKQYIKALFGANSLEYEQIKSIAFKPIKS